MRVEVFSLCDAATVDIGGKLNVLGAFDTIGTASVPVVYPHFAVALRIRFEAIERGEHRVTVGFVDQDGRAIIPQAEGLLQINFTDEQRSGSANLVLSVQRVKIEQWGEYSIDLAIDGRREASLPLFIRQTKS